MSKIFHKEGNRYIFASKKFSSINSLFGITKQIKDQVDSNLKKQTKYLKDHFISFNNEEDTSLSFFDMSKSANIKPNQYFGEMFNKVSTLQKYAKEVGFTDAIFMTITPPTYYKPLKQIELKNNLYKLVDNPRFCGVVDYVKYAREYESNKWRKFLCQKIFRDMKKKYGERMIYMRTYEPMIDGTPHVHIVAFIPHEYKERFIKLAINYFRETRFDIKSTFDEDIGGVVAYILKYILKSFSNSKTNKLDDVGYWYAFHQIRRFTTSRTLIPMKYYRLINRLEEFHDLLKTTKLYKKDYFDFQISISPQKILDIGFNNLKFSDYDICEVSLYVDDGYEQYFRVLYEKSENISIFEYDTSPTPKPPKIKRLDIKRPIPVIIDKKYYIFKDDKLIKINPVVSRFRDYQLYEYYKSLDPEDVDLKHFGLVQNECIKRFLIQGKIQPLNDFNTEIGV